MQLARQSSNILLILSLMLCATLGSANAEPNDPIPNDFEELFNKRIKSTVVIKLFLELEIDRKPIIRQGAVIDNEGRIIIGNLPLASPDEFKDFKIYIPGDADTGYSAEYLGFDELNRTHFIQAEEKVRQSLVPVTAYPARDLKTGEFVWGIGIMKEEDNFNPYFMNARLSIIQKLPLQYGFTLPGLASPGALVFTSDGALAGWASSDLVQEIYLLIQSTWIPAAVQRKDESGSFLVSSDFLEQIKRVPESPTDNSHAWAGIAGLQPVDKEVADLLGLEKQGAVVISDVVKDSPADKAGILRKDIITAFNGETLPYFKPNTVVIEYLQRQIKLKEIGDTIKLTVIRGEDEQEINLKVQADPTPYIDADWEYFPRLGFSIREFLIMDSIQFRTLKQENPGVITRFIKPNSAVSAAGLKQGDWIKEIDGEYISDYNSAVDLLKKINENKKKNDFVLLVSRDNETKVLRVKLN